ncbi:nucleolar protein 14-like [Argonauta hians]
MAKKKLDKFQKKIRKNEVKKVNPFEIKVNKQKHHILGRKLPKNEGGIPGVSRSKANKKRKDTLLQEYLHRFQDNQIVDKRIGENDANLSYDEKMNRRFVAEKQKYLDKKNIFSLNDEEDLTHYGQSLSEIETFEDPVNSDDEDYDGRITGKLIAEEHFGGGFLSQTNGDSEDKKKPWKERMEELITQSRKDKMEQQQVREETIRMTQMVDSEWKTLRFLMSDSNTKLTTEEPKPKVDDYDMNVRSLVFEARAMASNKMKSEKELAHEEMERLEKLEKERQRRMKAPWEVEKQKKRQYVSADALGDEQFLHPVLKDKTKKESKNNKKSVKFSDDVDFNDDDEEEEKGDNSEEEEEDDSDDDNEEESDDGEEEAEEEDSGDDDDGDDDSDDDDNTKVSEKKVDVTSKNIKKKKSGEEEEDDDEEEASSEEEEVDSKKLQEISEKAKNELPFVFKAPKTYAALKKLLESHSCHDQVTIIERIEKCNHPSLGDGNKAKLERVFQLLLTYYCEVCQQRDLNLWLIDRLVVKLFHLATFSPQPAAVAVLEAIKVRQSALKKTYPGLDTLLLLKLVPLLYPASDFRHFVCTPAMLYMSQILSQCVISCERDVAAGLFISTILLQCISMSKRYIPEMMNFLFAVFSLATTQSPKSSVFLPPFQISGCRPGLLHINKQTDSKTVAPLKLSWLQDRHCDGAAADRKQQKTADTDGSSGGSGSGGDDDGDSTAVKKEKASLDSDEFRLSAVHVALGVCQELCTLYCTLPSFTAVFQPIVCQLNLLPVHYYPHTTQDRISQLLHTIETTSANTTLSALVMKVKKKVTSLQLFQPKIEQVLEGDRKRSGGGGSAEDKERKKLLYKVKQETKGAIREIKKDAQFLAKHQMQEQKTRDSERKRKVKALYSFMENQEADYKKMKRTKEKANSKS